MVHNHSVWEAILQEVSRRYPSVKEAFGDWTKCRERIEYLKRKYRDCVKHNRRSGSDPMQCPYFEEMDAVLGCRPMTDPGDNHMDNLSSEDEHQPEGGRRRKGRKTQLMEALDKGLERIFQHDHDNTSDGEHLRHERERLEWEKEVERNRREFERSRLEFEMLRMEADERRARENRELMGHRGFHDCRLWLDERVEAITELLKCCSWHPEIEVPAIAVKIFKHV
ncbi:hypothetical protein SKAU_G00062880 [Synaphobranchus kaupii]|uniref:Myb/SANT-like DNA-binding domain-containing protein n=1 Tax=Synaphobranchus kaupii TaxID=118154 RepID=A0A9Q1JAJ1_SYNKA|nr:hypothetical protein SKAU_G00062880 [Synaphobranchus kaupii]